MAMKAVCVLKGTGEVTGTVHFEQQVSISTLLFSILAAMLTPVTKLAASMRAVAWCEIPQTHHNQVLTFMVLLIVIH